MNTPHAKGFRKKLEERIERVDSRLCVGLDPRPERIGGDVPDFLRRVVAETEEYAAAYKPNIAFFEAMGADGYRMLERLLPEIPSDIPVILDAKRSDIPETQAAYAKAYFEQWGVDAVTLNPLLGRDSIEPFLQDPRKGVYLLAITSNPGAQDILLRSLDGRPFLQRVQEMCLWARDYPASTGLVVGLPQGSERIFDALMDVPLLIPGLGTQGGDINRLCISGRKAPWLVNVSRAVLYPEPGHTMRERAAHFADVIRTATGCVTGRTGYGVNPIEATERNRNEYHA